MLRSRIGALVAILAFVLGTAAAAGAAHPAPDDPRAAWLRSHAIPIRSLDPADEDFSDLRPLRSALAGARVVVLGEATHGDGSTFLAKARLVRFLHRELGYDVLAFESGLYDCWKAWRRIEAGEDPAAAFRQSVFGIWTRSAQVQPLIDYFAAAAKSPRPLVLAGFDSQFTGELSPRFLLADLTRVADAVGLPGEDWAKRIAAPLANVVEARSESGELPDAAARSALLDGLAELEERVRRQGNGLPERAFWLRLLESTRVYAQSSWAMDFSRPLMESPDYPVRDRQMGEHLVWLARERFPGRKIVAWMHSGHAARGLSKVEVQSPVHARLYRTFKPAGAVARDALGKELYTVAVLAYEGSYGKPFHRAAPEELLRPSDGSLEDLFHRSGLPRAFLDLSRPGLPGWLRGPLIARPIGYKEMRAPWQEVYDGVLFLERMERSDPVPRPSQ